MDKETLSNYGWVVIAVLVLSIMIALATPFGTYISDGVKSTTAGLFKAEQNALNTALDGADVTISDQEFDGVPTLNGTITNNKTHGATFSKQIGNNCDDKYDEEGLCSYGYHGCLVNIDLVTLTWEELQLPENGDKYGYNESAIDDASIGDAAFECCEGLESITIPSSVTSIGIYAFFECYCLTSITIPDGITSIGDYAFGCCSSLTSITIPDSVTSMGDYAFMFCSGLTDIIIPGSVTNIGYCTFDYCNNITKVTILDGVTSIDYMAFHNCGLTDIIIPDSVTSIGELAFDRCGNLENITFDGTKAQWNAISLGVNWNGNGSYIIPATVVHCTDGDIAI